MVEGCLDVSFTFNLRLATMGVFVRAWILGLQANFAQFTDQFVRPLVDVAEVPTSIAVDCVDEALARLTYMVNQWSSFGAIKEPTSIYKLTGLVP